MDQDDPRPIQAEETKGSLNMAKAKNKASELAKNPTLTQVLPGLFAFKKSFSELVAQAKGQDMNPKEGDLKIWHIPQIPGKPFEMPVRSAVEGKLLLDALAQYDMFQLANNIKGDYSNAAGLSVFEDGEWIDWNDDEGNTLDETPALSDSITATDQKTKALLVIHQTPAIKELLTENDPKALEQVEKAITADFQFREALWAGKVVPSHATAAAKKVEDNERPHRRRRLP